MLNRSRSNAPDTALRVIVGLGNPEDEYKGTRHNAGFETIDALSRNHGIPVNKNKQRARTGQGRIAKQPVLLAKPQTYMNRSGESVRALLDFHKLTPEALIVVCDDTALAPGDIRVRARGSAGGHNGLKNIIAQLGTDEFTRVRVGIGQKPEGWDLADYVLSRFGKDEVEAMAEGVAKAAEAVTVVLCDGVDAAMNRFNKKNAATPTPEGDA